MATEQEKLAAANAALEALGASDPDEAKRFVALYWSQQALVPAPAPAPANGGMSLALIQRMRTDDPALQDRIDAALTEWKAISDALDQEAASP